MVNNQRKWNPIARIGVILIMAWQVAFTFLPSAQAQLSKGNLILIERGLQLQGLCYDDNYVTLSTYSNAHYTSLCWLNEYTNNLNGDPIATHSSRPDWMGTPPGAMPWSRWVRHEDLMAPHVTPYGGDETPFMDQLIALQLGDEWNLNDGTIRTRLVNWFNAVRSNYPNTILYHSSWGSQIEDLPLADFYTRAQPDMLSFDTYPWKSVWVTNDTAGAVIGGPPTGWYGDLRRYREHARGAGIPFAIYRQTFHAIQNYDATVYRDPSRSELRLNTFAGLAFNAKYFIDYTYNTGSFFERACNWCGDSVISSNGLFAEQSDINFRARNLGKALVRLKPIGDATNAYTTSLMFILGRDPVGSPNPIPVGFVPDEALPNSITDWASDRNDPYLRGWVVTNKGTNSNGQPVNNGYTGDVLISWFEPLDESFDGTNYTNQIYMMVVNGLTDVTGAPSNCWQEIKLNFLNTAATTSLIMLDPVTGQLQTNGLPLVSTRRQLALNLNGGDAALFKFNTGAPFVGFMPPRAARLGAQMETNGLSINIQGTVASRYRVETVSSLPSTNWTVLTNLLLPSASWTFHDAAPTSSQRFYRVVAEP